MIAWILRRARRVPMRGDTGREDVAPAVARADALRDAGRFGEAADAYAEALALAPFRADLRVQHGNMLKDSSQFAAAVAAYEHASAVTPQDADIHLQRGRALKLAGDLDAAVQAFRQALALQPRLVEAADELGRLAALSARETGVRSAIAARGPVEVSGWAFDTARPQTPVAIEASIDGVHYMRLTAALERGDLRRIAPEIVGGGFDFSLPPGDAEVDVEVRCKGEHLRGSPFRTALRAREGALQPRGPSAAASVTIVVPVYGAPRETAACLDALLLHTGAPARILVVDDASPNAETAATLARYASVPGIEIVRNELNLGYTRTVNRGLELSGHDDVVLMNSDAAVGPRWLDMLRQTAASAPDVASVTAVSDNAGAFTVPEPGTPTAAPEGWRLVDLQRFVAQTAGRLWPEVPTGNGFCMYLRRAALDVVGGFDAEAFPRGYGEENDWCMRAGALGWRHLVDDRVLVHHERSASFGAAKTALMEVGRVRMAERHPEYTSLTAAFHRIPAFAETRRRLRAGFAASPAAPRPRVLFVVSSETGGTPLTNRDLMRALDDRYDALLLFSDGRTMTLTRPGFGDNADVVVARRALSEPISFGRHVSREYDERIAGWMADYAVELLHVRHLARHSLNLPAIAQGMGVPTLMSFHDFYAVCPTVKLIDETTTYCGGRCTATPGDCRPDLWRLAETPPLKHRFVHGWREKFEVALRACDAFVTTSKTARALLIGSLPGLAGRRFEVIPHGRDFAAFVAPRAVELAPVLDILVPGNISAAKGRDLIAALAARDEGRRLRFHLLGDVTPPLKGDGVVAHGRYAREDFAARALATGASVGAVFSLWPETFCHTLTEMWAIGLPVVAFDFGAVAERLRATGAGWLVAHDDVETLHAAIIAIADDVEDRARKARRVVDWQEGDGVRQTCAVMAGAYADLYAQLRDARCAFSGEAKPA